MDRTPWRLVTSGARRWAQAALSWGRSTYPVAADAEVLSTPTPSAPAVEDCSMESRASGDWAAAAAAGEGLAGLAAPAAAYEPLPAARPDAMAEAYVGG